MIKRSTLLALLALSLVQTQHAQSADAEVPKGPLTAAEYAQCKVQLTEFNENVRANNAKLVEIRALEVEVEAVRAELNKEEAAVDRRDRTAMDALNAKIGKNNELVEQHEKMTLLIDRLVSENKQRGAAYSEACENRPLVQRPTAPTQPADSACNSTTSAKDVQRHLEATFVEIRANEKRHQAEVERVAQAQAKAQSWNREKQGKIWLQILGSPKFMAFEREKRPFVQELLGIVGSKPKNAHEECRILQRIAAMLPAIKAINARQYASMADEMRVAK
ncbi:hypothetical protein ABT364_08755 [Massilia sp. SR12]